MILRRLAEGIREQNWFTVALEILIVVIGIFLGLQANEWNEARKAKTTEKNTIERMIADIESDLVNFERMETTATVRIEHVQHLLNAVSSPNPDEGTLQNIAFLLRSSGFSSRISLTDYTFEEVRSSGQLELISSPELRRHIFSYYRWQDSRSQYDFILEHIQKEYQIRNAGVLSAEQQGMFWTGTNEQVNVAEGAEILKRIRENTDLIAWLPKLTSFQRSQQRDGKGGKQRALLLLDALKNKLAVE